MACILVRKKDIIPRRNELKALPRKRVRIFIEYFIDSRRDGTGGQTSTEFTYLFIDKPRSSLMLLVLINRKLNIFNSITLNAYYILFSSSFKQFRSNDVAYNTTITYFSLKHTKLGHYIQGIYQVRYL